MAASRISSRRTSALFLSVAGIAMARKLAVTHNAVNPLRVWRSTTLVAGRGPAAQTVFRQTLLVQSADGSQSAGSRAFR